MQKITLISQIRANVKFDDMEDWQVKILTDEELFVKCTSCSCCDKRLATDKQLSEFVEKATSFKHFESLLDMHLALKDLKN